MAPEIVGILGIGVLIILLFLRMPIGFSMALVGFLGFAYIGGPQGAFSNLSLVPFGSVANYTLAVLPLFLLMGNMASHAGISKKLYSTAHKWVGQFPGGLAMASIFGCAGFAAICGSSSATAAAMGRVAAPEMRRYHYDDAFAIGSIAAGGTIGILIPPSLGFIMYAMLTEESVGKLFISGIIPGISQAFIYILVILLICKRNPELAPRGSSTSFGTKIVSLKDTWSTIVLFVLVIGGIYLGVFTPSEGAAVGATGTLAIGVLTKQLSLRGFKDSILETVQLTAMILILFVGAMIFMRFLAITKIPFVLADSVASLNLSPYIILSLIILLYIILGCFLDILSAQVLTIPIIYPMIQAMGFNPIWFGVIMVRVQEIGLITPPVGMTCFILAGATDTPAKTVFRGITPFLMGDVFHIFLLVAIPQLSLFLPNLM